MVDSGLQYVAYYGLKFLKYVFILPLTVLISIGPQKKCPPIKNKLLMLSAKSLVDKLKTGQLTCYEIVTAYIERIREVNPIINAVVENRFEAAVKEAIAVDELIKSNESKIQMLYEEKPLLGIPLTVKESIAVAGMSHDSGRIREKSVKATKDADIITYLKDAGVIILLVSNTPELCMCWETFNYKIGKTSNPYNNKRTSGGSSGGEAALIGAGASVVGVGSDIGGSLRIPTMFNGVFGHKPTPGFVSNKGHYPSCLDEDWNRYFSLGPVSRYAEDLPLLLHTIIPDQPQRNQLNLFEPVDLSKIKLFYADCEKNSIVADNPCSDVTNALHKAVQYFKDKYGIEAQKIHVDGMEESLFLSMYILLKMNGIDNVFQKTDCNPNEWKSVLVEFIKKIVGCSKITLPALLFGPVKKSVDSISVSKYENLLTVKKRMMNDFQKILGSNGVFLYPVFPDPAHYHYQIYYKFLNSSYCILFNLLEMPVTACPLGLNRQGLPVGIQIVGWQCQDRLTIAVSQELEKEFGGWIPPPTN